MRVQPGPAPGASATVLAALVGRRWRDGGRGAAAGQIRPGDPTPVAGGERQ